MRIFSSLLELIGFSAVAFGAWCFDWRAGVLVAGVLLALLGFLLDRPEPDVVE